MVIGLFIIVSISSLIIRVLSSGSSSVGLRFLSVCGNFRVWLS